MYFIPSAMQSRKCPFECSIALLKRNYFTLNEIYIEYKFIMYCKYNIYPYLSI